MDNNSYKEIFSDFVMVKYSELCPGGCAYKKRCKLYNGDYNNSPVMIINQRACETYDTSQLINLCREAEMKDKARLRRLANKLE